MKKKDKNYALSLLPINYKVKTKGALQQDDLIWVGSGGVWLTAASFVPKSINTPIDIFTLVATKENEKENVQTIITN